ncbi:MULTISPECIES: hypothetical protein [Methylomonas]|uniref:DUF2178 domain-containing protein n=2 Tax=Methylomonas TaxID=416 RepID=A0A140E4A8_9GAMM|nr:MULTISPECIES: hypothetical protein [Methylomonas]AMK75232.1 hypothetical protein JT25_001810 [Methylomonas denitrificans]OAH99374.1 hypothetical protein A1342_04405 [Methylomonas methanica]TCV85021.1 hypothetical protein EDE11_106132 [Methylomonas methanica]
MKYNPFLIAATSICALLSTLAVLIFVFSNATADIASHLNGEEAIVLYIALCSILLTVFFYFKKNQGHIERLFSGRQTAQFAYRHDITTYLVAGFVCAGAASEFVKQDKALYDNIVLISGIFLLLSIIAAIYRRFWPSKKSFR